MQKVKSEKKGETIHVVGEELKLVGSWLTLKRRKISSLVL
jgi:hypothetical protein